MKYNVVRNDRESLSTRMRIMHDNSVKGDASVSTVC